MRRVATAAGRLAAVLVPLNGVVALGLTLVYLVAGRLADRPVAPRARMPRWWRLGTVMLVVAVALAPTPYLPWSTPASIDPAEDNLVLTQDVARWNPTLTNGASVPAPVLGQTAACVVVPPQRALTHTVVIPAHAADWTGSLYVRTTAGEGHRLVVRLGPPGAGGRQVQATVGEDWQRLVATTVTAAEQAALTVALFNPEATRALTLCVWGAQVEAGAEATPFRSFVAQLEEATPDPALRWASVALVLAGSYALWWLLSALAATTGPGVGGQLGLLLVGLAVQLGTVVMQSLTGDGRPIGLAGHANILGAQAAVVAGLIAAALPRTGRSARGDGERAAAPLRLALSGIAVATTIVVLSGSRTAALALVVGAVVWLATARWGRRRAAVALVVGVALLAVAGVWELRGAGLGGWDSSRLSIYPAAVDAWLASPVVGWGPGTGASRVVIESGGSMSQVPAHAHSLFLQLAVEYGALGLVAFGAAVVAVARGLRTRPAWAPAVGLLLPLAAFDLAVLNPNVYVCLLWWFMLAVREPAPAAPRP